MAIVWKHKNLVGHAVEKETEYAHPTVEGLRLRAYPNGRKTWVWQRMMDGKRRKKTLGRFPAVTLSMAQAMGDELNGQIECGETPLLAREIEAAKEAETRMTVAEAWKLYIADMERRGVRTSELTDQRGQKDIIPVVGTKFIRDVTSDDIREIVKRPLERGRQHKKSRASTGGGSMSNMMATLARMFFNFCFENGYDDLLRNPAIAVKKMRVEGSKKSRTLSMREMALVVLAAREFDRQRDNTTWADLITMICMNGNRKSEVLEAPSSEWDSAKRCWRINADRYKTIRDVSLPVGPTTAAIFERHCHRKGFLFPYQTGVRTGNDTHIRNHLWTLMEEIGGEKIEKWDFHSMRYGFRSNIRKAKIADSELAERIIHPNRKDAMSAHYDDDWFDEMREALEEWDAHLNAEIAKIVAERMRIAA